MALRSAQGSSPSRTAEVRTAETPFRVVRRRCIGTVFAGLIVGMVLAFAVAPAFAFGSTEAGGGFTLTAAPRNPAFVTSLQEEVTGVSATSTLDEVAGYRPGPLDPGLSRGMQMPSARLGALPASYDLRVLGRVTPAKDQLLLETCWTFAALGSLESCLIPGETWDFSEDHMALTHGFDDDDPGVPGQDPYDQGNLVMATAYLARWGGPVNEADDPYGDGHSPSGLVVQKHVQGVNWIPERISPTDNANIKQAVLDHGGVFASMYMNTGLQALAWNESTDAYYYSGSVRSNHAVLIVGWDDDYPASNFVLDPGQDGAFVVKNSYGVEWGDGGYFYVSYYDASLGRDDLMAVFADAEPANNYSRVYQYDPLGCIGILGVENGNVGWFANAFTAQETGKVSAVGFYAPVPGSSYEVYTGTGFASAASGYYTLSAKTLRTSGTLAYMGYHTVALPSPVNITAGQKFVVAVKLTTPDLDYPICIEEPVDDWSSNATAAVGQSYVSDDGGTGHWMDLNLEGYSGTNVCLKAYAAPVGPPTITGLSPNFGSTAGSKSVVVTGTNFVGLSGADAVTFAGVDALGYTVDSATQITAITPPHAAGPAQVQVRASGGTTMDTGADDYTYMPPVAYTSIRGIHRYETAQLISQAMFPAAIGPGGGVVVAPGETYQEALCGAPLAAAWGGPVLLTPTVGLENGTKAELQRLQPGTIFVIGLSTAIRDAVQAAVPGATVILINGPVNGTDVYTMSRQIANYLETKMGDMTDATAIITIGTNFPDAIGVSPLACAMYWPILLTDLPDGSPLHAQAAGALTDLGITQAIKVGTYAELPGTITGLANLSGADRYVTNANVANWAKANAGLSFAHTAIATGDKFPDALASGPYLAGDEGILLLSPLLGPLPTVIAGVITTHRLEVQHVTFIACIEPVISQVKGLLP